MTSISMRDFAADLLRIPRILAFLALDSICLCIPVKRRNTALTLRLDAVGDFFMWLQSGAPEVAAFARRSGRHSVIVANRAWADYARLLDLWDEVMDVDPVRFMRNPIYRLGILWWVRRSGADILIQPRSSRVFLQEDEISRVSGASMRFGNSGTFVHASRVLRRFGDRSYDRMITVNQDKTVHETVRNEEFARGLTGEAASRFDFGGLHLSRTDDVVVVAVGAGQIGRVWPMEKYAKLLSYIEVTRPSSEIVLLGSVSDGNLACELQRLVGGRLKNLVGKTSLRGFVDAIAASRLVICNDSSAFHVAMALEKRVICFLGGGHYGWFAPYPEGLPASSRAHVLTAPMECYWCNWNCIHPRGAGGSFRCVESIPIQKAIDALESIPR